MTRPTQAVERTALAWRRTALTATATSALFMTHLLMNRWGTVAFGAMAAAAALLGLVLLAMFRNYSLQRGKWTNGNVAVAITTAIVAAVSLTALGMEMR